MMVKCRTQVDTDLRITASSWLSHALFFFQIANEMLNHDLGFLMNSSIPKIIITANSNDTHFNNATIDCVQSRKPNC